MSSMRQIPAFILILAALFCSGPPAHARSQGRQAPPRIQYLEALVIEGKLQKPQVFYVLSRRRIRYEYLQPKRSFLKEITRSVRRNPF